VFSDIFGVSAFAPCISMINRLDMREDFRNISLLLAVFIVSEKKNRDSSERFVSNDIA